MCARVHVCTCACACACMHVCDMLSLYCAGALFYGSDEFELLDRTNNPTIGRGNIGHDQNGTLRQVVESSQGKCECMKLMM